MICLKFRVFAGMAIALLFGNGCTDSKAYTSPVEYDLKTPVVHKLDAKLAEISGICFKPGDDQQLFAIEDEHAKLYRITPDGSILGRADFGNKGDYEDVAITNNTTYILRSDGTIFSAPVPISDVDIVSTSIKDVLPSGEYEGMTAESGQSLIALCKDCNIKGTKGKLLLYRIAIGANNVLKASSPIEVTVLDESKGDKKEKLAPSALARNPVDGKWYIVSSVNKLLIVLNADMTTASKYNLDPKLFPQPEGICFNSKGTLFISNEGAGSDGTILQFNKR